MKIFLSWSKPLSRLCAELVGDWIKCTLQATSPWISSKDIDKGTLWFNEINTQLKDTGIGIVFLTKENKNNPWILFESGALAKGLTSNKVCTFLLDLSAADLEPPLSQFNHTFPDKESVRGLLSTINDELGELKLESKILDQVFDTYWPQFETDLNKIIQSNPSDEETVVNRTEEDLLTEILYTTRALDKRIRYLESPSTQTSKLDKQLKFLKDENISIVDTVHILRKSGLNSKIIADKLGISDEDVQFITANYLKSDGTAVTELLPDELKSLLKRVKNI